MSRKLLSHLPVKPVWNDTSTQRRRPVPTVVMFPLGARKSSLSVCAVDFCSVSCPQANVAQFLNDVPNNLPLCCGMSLRTSFVTRRSCAWVGPPRLPTTELCGLSGHHSRLGFCTQDREIRAETPAGHLLPQSAYDLVYALDDFTSMLALRKMQQGRGTHLR